jgi:hypothetical protein
VLGDAPRHAPAAPAGAVATKECLDDAPILSRDWPDGPSPGRCCCLGRPSCAIASFAALRPVACRCLISSKHVGIHPKCLSRSG